ncbi:hypothetical protein ACFQX7_24760 [Luedemannella flava]
MTTLAPAPLPTRFAPPDRWVRLAAYAAAGGNLAVLTYFWVSPGCATLCWTVPWP